MYVYRAPSFQDISLWRSCSCSKNSRLGHLCVPWHVISYWCGGGRLLSFIWHFKRICRTLWRSVRGPEVTARVCEGNAWTICDVAACVREATAWVLKLPHGWAGMWSYSMGGYVTTDSSQSQMYIWFWLTMIGKQCSIISSAQWRRIPFIYFNRPNMMLDRVLTVDSPHCRFYAAYNHFSVNTCGNGGEAGGVWV